LIIILIDGTTELIEIIITRQTGCPYNSRKIRFGNGGCWNEAISHPECGKFSVQLDSEIYSDENTLAENS